MSREFKPFGPNLPYVILDIWSIELFCQGSWPILFGTSLKNEEIALSFFLSLFRPSDKLAIRAAFIWIRCELIGEFFNRKKWSNALKEKLSWGPREIHPFVLTRWLFTTGSGFSSGDGVNNWLSFHNRANFDSKPGFRTCPGFPRLAHWGIDKFGWLASGRKKMSC